MVVVTNWWEAIFNGTLKIGLNEQKTYQLEDESFLYLTIPTNQQEQEYEKTPV